MKTKEIKVSNCKTCPFSEIEYFDTGNNKNKLKFGANCLAPLEIHKGKYVIDSYFKNHKSPKWCPLKENQLKIIHK